MVDTLLVGAEGVYAEVLSEVTTSEYTGFVCRVWWDVLVEGKYFLEEGGMDGGTTDGDDNIQVVK